MLKKKLWRKVNVFVTFEKVTFRVNDCFSLLSVMYPSSPHYVRLKKWLRSIFYLLSLDVNECQTNNGGCEQICTNNPGSHRWANHTKKYLLVRVRRLSWYLPTKVVSVRFLQEDLPSLSTLLCSSEGDFRPSHIELKWQDLFVLRNNRYVKN